MGRTCCRSFLYLFPVILMAAFLPRWVVGLLAIGCAILAEKFSSLEPSFVRLAFETLALGGCGLFVAELIRNRRLTLEGQAKLEALVETSPAAIVTVDERGLIEMANQAAGELLAPRDNNLTPRLPSVVRKTSRSDAKRPAFQGTPVFK